MGTNVSEQRPPGRRRALDGPDTEVDEAASHAQLADMWRGISRAQDVLGRRRSLFENTTTDELLAEQFALVAILHDWSAITEGEADELTYLLGLYAEPPREATTDEVAHAINGAIRRMLVRRGKLRRAIPPQGGPHVS